MEVDSARLERALKAAAQACTNESHGIHGPDSLAWKLGGEALNFLGGGRAALLQLAHPAVAYAIDQHSTTRSDPRGRFQRTFEMVYAMVFGDWPAAEKAARRVHRIHRQVVGSVGEDAGDFAAGDRYAANQVGYLRWVWATLVDTLLVVHDRFGGGLSLDDKRNYLRESTAFAGLFGLSLEDLPGSYEDFKYYFNRMLASGALQITKPAREIAEFLFEPPLPALAPMLRWYRMVTGSLLPARLAEGFGMELTWSQGAAVRASLSAVRLGYRRLPGGVRMVPAYHQARRRVSGRGPVPPPRLSMWRLIQTLLAQGPR